MTRPATKPPELVLPVASLRALRASLADEIGADSAAVVLRAAGHAAGDAFLATMAAVAASRSGEASGAEKMAGLDGNVFWRRTSEFFSVRGWGHLHFQQPHEGVGALESRDWVEADAEGAAERPSCHFTTGMLANLLGGVAGRDVAVLEAECRSRGDARCVFLFGARETLNVVFDDLVAGSDLRRALLELV
jgi:predicted hydrocarbon binding protein